MRGFAFHEASLIASPSEPEAYLSDAFFKCEQFCTDCSLTIG